MIIIATELSMDLSNGITVKESICKTEFIE